MSKAAAVTVAIIVAIILFGYLIFVIESFKNSTWIFTPFVPTPPGDDKSCYPLIEVKPFTTQDQFDTVSSNTNRANGGTGGN